MGKVPIFAKALEVYIALKEDKELNITEIHEIIGGSLSTVVAIANYLVSRNYVKEERLQKFPFTRILRRI